jgi:hypothetical protein
MINKPSLKSRLVIFSVQHRHLIKGWLKRDVITLDTSTVQLRNEFDGGAKKFGSVRSICI